MFSSRIVKGILSAAALFNEVVAIIICSVAVSVASLIAVQPPANENPCSPPGVTVLTDPSGDTSAALGLVATPAPPGTDLLSLQISQPPSTDGILRLAFTFNTDAGESPQPLGSAWYAAVKTPSGYKAVHMTWNPTSPTTPVFESYTPSTNLDGGTDGRFVEQGSQLPAESSSSYVAPFNKVIIIVKASDLGLHAGDTISGFVAAVSQTTDPGSTTGTGATALYDQMPNSLALNGSYTLLETSVCMNGGPTPTPTPTSTPTPGASPNSTPDLNSTTPSFSIHMSPAGMGESWGEPSIGVNWQSEQVFNGTPNGGTVMSFGGFGDGSFPDVIGLRVTFNDSNPAAPTATWEHTASMAVTGAPRAAGDPILYTDRDTGRTFFTQLLGLTPLGSTTQFTDDDGRSFSVSEGSGLPSGIDHETFGGGPFATPLTGGATYQNAVYYCSQSVGDATCSISLDGGATFGPSVPIYGVNDCTGLHGHLKVGRDGTAYVPNKGCGGSLPYHLGSQQAVIVSDNNGLSWTVRPVTTSTGDGNNTKSDPSIGIGADGTVYFAYQANDGHQHVSVSRDKGQTWSKDTDLGATLGIQNSVFPAAIAGDGDRAAVAFFGTTTAGANYHCGQGDNCADDTGANPQPPFNGVWYLYIATTYDGGATWTTVNATPGDPIQRGGICGQGDCRNLLDFFDAGVDKEGRILVGYDDGCISAGCIAGTAGNDFTAKNAIARQLSGKRLFAAYDPNPNATPTPTPNPTVTPTPTPTPTATPTPTPTPSPSPTATPTPGTAPPAATFGHNTLADFSAVGGEPFIKVDKHDNIYVSSPFGVSTTVSLLWKSSDHGRTFIPLGSPVTRDAITGPGGGDTHMDFDDQNRLYYSDLSAACVTTAVSEDGGNTFPLTRENPISCVGADDPEGVTDDRQWIAAFGDGIGYVSMRNFAVGLGSGNFHLFKTSDGGQHWDGGRIIGNVSQSGPLEVDKQLRTVTVNGTPRSAILLYQIYYTGNTLKVMRVTDLNDGSPMIVNDLTIPTGGGSVATVFPVMSVDRAGNLYAVWSNGGTIKMAASTDHGDHWTPPAVVNPPSMTGMNIMPWIVAGDPGRVDVIWYHTFGGNNESARWDINMAQTLDALSGNPAFNTNKVNENTIHTGEICLEGLNCDIDTLAGTPRDRSFAEFPSIDIDSKGAAYITYNDSTNQLPAPYVMVARQTGGASLFNSVGSLDANGGSVTISSPATGDTIRTTAMTLSGTHTLTPRNFDRDENGDANFPDHGAVIGSNIPALDLKAVSLSDDSASVTVNMQIADLTTTALATAPVQSGGDGVLYLTQMHSGNTVYWVGAEIRAGTARYLTGTLGSINSSTSKKYITYNPDLANSLSVQGSYTATAPGTITMKIPKGLLGNPAAGTIFTSVTGYTMTERGPLAPSTGSGTANPTSLPIQVDAAGALSYTIGDGAPRFNGVVEVSIDDPNFTAPHPASVGDPVNSNSWSLQLTGADLVAGSHTAYVRQRLSGLALSPIASVSFTVSSTVEQPVTSMVNLVTSNAKSSLGISQYDVSIRNASSSTIYAPLRIEVASITSASGRVSVSNADNGKTGAGASWDYSTKAGLDNMLTASEISLPRTFKFTNPNNEPFSVTFNVIGNVDRSVAAASSNGSSGGGGGGASEQAGSSGVTSLLYSIAYNPLLNSITSQIIKP